MAAHRHFTSKLLMKWRGSDGLQLLNWQSLKQLVLQSQVSNIKPSLVLTCGGFCVWERLSVQWFYSRVAMCMNLHMFRILSFHDYPFPCHCFNVSDWFIWIKTWPHGWQVGFQPSSAIVQIILSLVRLCLLLSEVLCFHAVWSETFLWLFSVFPTSKNCTSDNNLCSVVTFYIFINVIS